MTTLAPSYPITGLSAVQTESSRGINKLLSNRLACHVAFWTFVFGFNAAYIAFIGEDRNVALINLALRIPFVLACCYINLSFLLPKFYQSGSWFVYAILVLIVIFSVNAVNLFFLEAFVETPICPTTFEADATFNGSNYVYKSFYLFSLVGLTSGIKLSKDHFASRQKAEAIEKEKLQTELSFLKSQINPHFFFNTLNNLYALTMKRSDQAPDMVLKLSDLMSYSLYESEGVSVSFQKEVRHIQNYIELESIRLGKKLTVDFQVNGLTLDRLVPPLIFLPLIENCFKHAVSSVERGQIRIEFTVHTKYIQLITSNPARINNAQSTKGGLGLRNMRRRLDLLYGEKYKLQTELKDERFSAILEIPAVW